MKSRSGRDERDLVAEVALLDVVIAILGPVLLLMLLFFVSAVRNVNQLKGECQPIAAEERGLLVADVTKLRASLEQEKLDLEVGLKNCDVAQTSAPQTEMALALMPAPIAKLCTADRAKVLAEAGLQPEALSTLMQDVATGRSRLAACVLASNEKVGSRVDDLQFRLCRARSFEMCPQEEQTCGELMDHFYARARDMIENLSKGSFNRVDILGHTDSQAIQSACDGATTNEELAALRALQYRTLMVQAVNVLAASSAEAADVSQRIRSGELRIYAIAVGSAEPVVRNATSESQHKRNRRIEIRYVHDLVRS